MPRSFVIGDTGEEIIVATWHPDPKVMEEEILLMANEFENWSVPLQEAKQAMIVGTQRRFDTETDPDGNEWQPLTDRYYAVKTKMMAGPDLILQQSERLVEAATSEEAWFTTESSVFFNAEALPKNPEDNVNYGMAHQGGTGYHNPGSVSHNKLRAFSFLSNLPAGTALNEKQTSFLETNSLRGKNLPARPFIGVDQDTEDEIEAIFLAHLDNTVTKEWDKPLDFGSNVLGTFPVMGRLGTGQPILRTFRGPRFGRM